MVDASASAVCEVWDGIFSPEDLRQVAAAGTERAFDYISITARSARGTPLESAINSILDALGDESHFVELWWRGEACNVLAHRDVDEKLCRSGERCLTVGRQRCPCRGHVLYLDIDPTVTAPTCIWEEEAATSTVQPRDEADREGGAPRALCALHVVPAVTNRLLRFRGDALHAVPQPPLAYLGEGDRGETPPCRLKTRAVLLFNTWEVPPKQSMLSPALETPSLAQSSLPRCRQRCSWTPSPSHELGDHPHCDREPQLCKVRAPLLGDRIRRGGWQRDLVARADGSALARALTATHAVHAVKLLAYAGDERLWGAACRCFAQSISPCCAANARHGIKTQVLL